MARCEKLSDACYEWVQTFNAIPYGVIEKLLKLDVDDVIEITPPSKYDRVYIFGDEYEDQRGEIIQTQYDNENDLYLIRLDDSGEEVVVSSNDFDVERESFLPMWGTLWTFSDGCDEEWANGKYLGPHLQEMADCGFRIYAVCRANAFKTIRLDCHAVSRITY